MDSKKIAIVFFLLFFTASAFAAKDYMMATVTQTGATGARTTTTTTSGGDSGGGGGGTQTTETIYETTTQQAITGEELATILAEAGYSEEQIESAKALTEEVEITQTVKLEKIVSESGAVSYKTTITTTITNSTGMDWKNMTVVVEIPKAVAADASEITSPLSFIVLKADPLLQFLVDVPSGTSKIITWSVAKNINKSTAETIKAPIIAAFTKEVPAVNKCTGVNCDDSNPCTVDSCDAATGSCAYSNVADNTVCGTGLVCTAGQCVEQPVTPPSRFPLWAIAIIVIIVIAIAYYYFVAQKKKK